MSETSIATKLTFEDYITEGAEHMSRALSLLGLMMEINTPDFWLGPDTRPETNRRD